MQGNIKSGFDNLNKRLHDLVKRVLLDVGITLAENVEGVRSAFSSVATRFSKNACSWLAAASFCCAANNALSSSKRLAASIVVVFIVILA